MVSRPIRHAAALALWLVAAPLAAQPQSVSPASVVPLPPAEAGLPIVAARQVARVAGSTKDLEGAVFLPGGDLLFSDVQGHRILRRTPDGRIAVVAVLPDLMPGGMAVGPDGRLYIAAGAEAGGGAIVSMTIDGRDRRTIVGKEAGFFPNDIVFDKTGGFYFTDARGSVGDPAGSVVYVSAGHDPVTVIPHLAVANGIALSPDGKTLWVGEFALGRLYRIDLKDASTPMPFGATTAYHFTGPAPDSMRTDPAGRVYVTLYGQGRVLVFAPSGVPIGHILLPERDRGENLSVTSLAIRPGSGEMAIVASSGRPNSGAIFEAPPIPR